MAKLSVLDAIGEKRNAVHSAMKKKFLGKDFFVVPKYYMISYTSTKNLCLKRTV